MIKHLFLALTASLVLPAFAIAQEKAHTAKLHRFGLDLGATYTLKHVDPYGSPVDDPVDLHLFGGCAGITYHTKPGHTWRLSFKQTAEWVQSTQVEGTLRSTSWPYDRVDTAVPVQQAWSLMDVSLDGLFRPARWRRGTTGLYILGGLGVRNMKFERRVAAQDEALYDSMSRQFDYSGLEANELRPIYQALTLIRAGIGFDLTVGPLVAYAEIATETTCELDLLGAGIPLTMRYGAAVGLRYIFGQRSTH